MSELVLGWRVTADLEPQYWLNIGAKPGLQPEDELVTVHPETMATHSIIVGQSGSGKSFFLGRLIEELVLQTKANLLILDPNADFIRVHKIQDSTLWTQATYDLDNHRGKLPHEDSRQTFKYRWNSIPTKVLTRRVPIKKAYPNTYPLVLWLPSISADLLFDEESTLQSQLYHCHAFTQAIVKLTMLKQAGDEFAKKLGMTAENAISEAERLYKIWSADFAAQKAPVISKTARLVVEINKAFDKKQLVKVIPSLEEETRRKLGFTWYSEADSEWWKKVVRLMSPWQINQLLNHAIKSLSYVDNNAGRFYFGKVREYLGTNILTGKPQLDAGKKGRITVIDLPSLGDYSTRLLAINVVIRDEWNRARADWAYALEQSADKDDRVPTFIVLDEAHHFIPAEPQGKAESVLRDQFRTIAAEGRKYGIFLILASQRPDKLDPIVLSECENKALMRLDSRAVLSSSKKNLGLDDMPEQTLEKCLEFPQSGTLIAGRWASGEPRLLYCAARRTVEGGRNLRAEYWATPY